MRRTWLICSCFVHLDDNRLTLIVQHRPHIPTYILDIICIIGNSHMTSVCVCEFKCSFHKDDAMGDSGVLAGHDANDSIAFVSVVNDVADIRGMCPTLAETCLDTGCSML